MNKKLYLVMSIFCFSLSFLFFILILLANSNLLFSF